MIINSQMTELGYSLKSYRVRNNITTAGAGRSSRRKYQYNHLWKQKYANQ